MKRGTRSSMLALALSLSAFCAGTAAAQNEKALAKEAYDRGTQAHERGDFRRAAEDFARADALAPSPIALQAALDAAVDADDAILGAELLARSKRATATGALAASIEAATKKLGGRAGHVHIACPNGAKCTSTVDGAPLDSAKGAWMRVGPHTLVVQVDGAPDTRTIEIHAGEDLEVVPVRGGPTAPAPVTPAVVAPPPSPVTAPPPSRSSREAHSAKPLAPVVFWVTAGATLVIGGVATGFGFAAKGKHDDFIGNGCDKANASPCGDLGDTGTSLQRFANIGFAVTGVAALTTVIVGAFFTDWAGAASSGRAPMIAPVAEGMGLSYGSRF